MTIDNPPPDACCACDCDCMKPLTQGNAMGEDVTDDPSQPWEKPDPDAPRVVLLICADCYVGKHLSPLRRSN